MSNQVDEYTISLNESPEGFKTLELHFKLPDGTIVGPLSFPPAYARHFADELTIAAVRAAGRSTGEVVAGSADASR